MKLVTYSTDKLFNRLGIINENNKIVDLQLAYADKLSLSTRRATEIAKAILPSNPIDFLESERVSKKAIEEALKYAEETNVGVYDMAGVNIGPPILTPNKIICVGLNYADHINEMERSVPEYPVVFAKFNNSLTGPFENFPLRSSLTQKLDYEGELAFIIGKTATKVTEEEALNYVAGYTVANDISARDMQKRTLQWLQGKNLNKSLPLGPWLVTTDELQNPHNLTIETKVNGEIRQKSNTSNLVFNVNKLVKFLSNIMTLEVGDIVLTGTPGGVGEASESFLKDGDLVTVEIERIGKIENIIKQVD